MRIAGSEAKSLDNSHVVNGSKAFRTPAEEDLKALIETFADEQHAPKRKKPSRMEGGVRHVWPLQLLVVMATEGPSLCLPSPGGAG